MMDEIRAASRPVCPVRNAMPEHTPLTADDLISNEPLRAADSATIPDDDDRFQHRHVARRVAQLVATPGTNVNVAVNGPWGSGKSTFFALLKEELASFTDEKKEPRFTTIDFDAWQMADETFESNFLATVAAGTPNGTDDMEQKLFRANRTVSLPFGVDLFKTRARKVAVIVAIGLLVALGLGVVFTQTFAVAAVTDGLKKGDWGPFFTTLVAQIVAVLGTAASGTILVVLVTTLANLRKVTVQESSPAHVTQFRALFKEVLKDATATHVILIDELDRCAPEAVMRTLEGLRRFLGHEKCVFVVAFDRESVVEAVDSELTRKVPTRPGRPYYSTAGEYLDKIFTYQVALPPQPRKAFRKYARDLVHAKGDAGVWGQLRAEGAERLERVLSILSPPHLTSPRRTKVILNDFAINARLTESFTGSWVERADEIAVLSVLQTEFPLFYADLEHFPNLLVHLADPGHTPPGATLKPILARYRRKGAAYDTVLSDTETDTNLDPNRALAEQLKRFLQKLRDMRVPLPGADLIQLGTSRHILTFDDPAIYSIVEAATEVPRNETLLALFDASPADQYRAVELMLQTSEGEAGAEALTLRVIAGTMLLGMTPERRAALTAPLNSAWQRLSADQEVTELDERAFEGFTTALLPLQESGAVSAMLDATHGDVDLHSLAVLVTTSHASDTAFVGNRARLLDSALDVLPGEPRPLLAFLRRLNTVDSPQLDASAARKLAVVLKPDDPANDDISRAAVNAVVADLARIIRELPTPSKVRKWLVSVLRQRALSDVSAVDEYVAVLDADLADPKMRTVATEEILQTLAMKTTTALKSTLAARLSADAIPGVQLLPPALFALLRLVATGEDDEAVRAGIATIADLGGRKMAFAPDDVADIVEDIYADGSALTRARYDALLDVARSLSRVTPLQKVMSGFIVTLATTAVTAVPDSADRVHVLHGLGATAASEARRVAEILTAELPGTNGRRKWIVDTVVCAHHRLIQLGEPVAPLSASQIQPYLMHSGDNVALWSWVQTAPPAADVVTVLNGDPLRTIPAAAWESYAELSTVADRTDLWRIGVDTGEPLSTLKIIASHGVDDATRTLAGQALVDATNHDSRARALRAFDTLPCDAQTAAAVVEPLVQWLKEHRMTEMSMVLGLLRRHARQFDRAAMVRLKEEVPSWIAHVSKKLSPTAVEELRKLGYLTPAPKATRRPRPSGKVS